MIEFQSATKRFPDGTVAVRELDLTVEAGTITVFVGPSGCGKTTSLRMVNRMVEPTSGTVLVDGVDVLSSDPARLRRGIGYVIQHAGLFPHRTVLDNIATVPLLSGWTRRKARSRAAELLELVGLAGELGSRYPAQLSGGQQQRVGVARALAADPPVLLMDEPFSAVDPVVREGLQDELLRLQNDLDKTVVFVTHDIDEAVRIGERVAVFAEGGRLAQYVAPAELLASPADDFVADFVGRDRGYRGLSFLPASDLALGEVATTEVGATRGGLSAEASAEDWVLVLDGDRRPRGWLAPDSPWRRDRDAGELAESDLVAGGSLHTDGGALRGALDAALSAPSGLGVVVDDSGRYRGVITPSRVLDLVERRRSKRGGPSAGATT
ncbi:ABC transporter ATP-binding protein [Actinoalloteichus hymeniacidonis]|uniref:ABC-type quaternary amine transporter n=1 Tax=Actinoalloteichus hymeniacidonis TaxID=340345 RepID=A0AAC9HTY4_9PSEU|nr:ATP-binding cassette domain-containing protein [Actinoalloteichus hymeniacidonis]AOS65403.1 ABC-type proline/glycine betaine transport system, ATPase component [Actinoalloteichus hymeniacidonis]MBB5906511.1 osmoprotectant transport system ATP-binding protein [Actinoalloteichus hymeniacidonis]